MTNRLKELDTLLHDAYRYFAKVSEEDPTLSQAAEWLLDNFYIGQQALRQIREDMPAGFYRQLPKLATLPFEGFPRVYSLAREVIGYCENRLEVGIVTRFVHAHQRIKSLTMGELWALPTMLRLGTLENLVEALARITGLPIKDSREIAIALSFPMTLTDEEIVASSIVSLRTLAAQDWTAFFENVSHVEGILRGDPAEIYPYMDFDTRDRYRKVIEELARRTSFDEEEVAKEAIKLIKDVPAQQGTSRVNHVGFYLLDAGLVQLEARINFQPSWRLRLRRWVFAHPTLIYFNAIGLLALAILYSLIRYVHMAGGNFLHLIGTSLLLIIPGLTVAVDLINWLITNTVQPRVLPKMEFKDGIPTQYCSVIAIPALLSHPSDVESVLQQMEQHYLGNADPHLHFILLTDFVDAPQLEMPGDQALLDLAKAGIQVLNTRYARETDDLFYLFHRQRKWNSSEDCWMGWERKRGKLVELNRLILGETSETDRTPVEKSNGETSFSLIVGDLDILSKVKYVITLDDDTTLPPGGARRLISALAHPLNRAEFDPVTGDLISGYTVLQPRVEMRPASANQSIFTRIFSGDIGLDLYSRAVSDVYQDFFGEGIYAGKGIYDVAAFEHSLNERVPENTLLSHDLFEGIHGRAGLVTDVILLEDYPPNYHIYTQRLHRWIRGDWQLLPWLSFNVPRESGEREPNDLSVLNRWKIFDNLRRSLIMPSLLALIIAGWLWLPGSAIVWMMVVLLTPVVPFATSLVSGLIRGLRNLSMEGFLQSIQPVALRWLLAIIFFPHEAIIVLDAVAATLVRLLITHRRLLQWTPAAHSIRIFGLETKLALMWRRMIGAPVISMALAMLVWLFNPVALPIAAPLLLPWLISPMIAHWISLHSVYRPPPLSADQRQQLRGLARRTWCYFEQFIGPDDHWLPPDHFQEDPRGIVAHRTSPTNIGLMLLSTLAAFDMGYLGPLDLVLRLRATFDTMDQLERYRGHFLNWYDTSTLEPLPPRYVSTVDSGNLAACLLALRQGCLELPQTPILLWQRWQGLLDILAALSETLEDLDSKELEHVLRPLQAYLDHLRDRILAVQYEPENWPQLWSYLYNEAWQELNQLLTSFVESGASMLDAMLLSDMRICADHIQNHLFSANREASMMLRWLTLLKQPPRLFQHLKKDPTSTEDDRKDIEVMWQALVAALPTTARLTEVKEVCRAAQILVSELRERITDQTGPLDQIEEARIWCKQLNEELRDARMAVEVILYGYRDLAELAEVFFNEMDFGFLFDPKRQVFHIGHNVAAEKLDQNYYDLLASESRIASLLAIAKGDVPQSHWLHLARPLTKIDGTRVLLSWNGSMFEYLMPLLLLRGYEETLLNQSCRVIVRRQIQYARHRGSPWGISESGYYRFDANMNYQYRGFGIPGLGFRRGLGEDLVISPYASLIALSLFPQSVMGNIQRLLELKMVGHYGFYEAIDYTSSRLPAKQEHAIVQSYMAHHQGMILIALANYLQDEVMVRRFHADPRVQSVDMLLQERVPRRVSVEYPHPQEVRPIHPAESLVVISPWQVPVDRSLPYVNYLSNGRYCVFITSSGGGFSRWQGIDLTRWRADTTLDAWGTWIYIQDRDLGALWSATYQPTVSPPESQTVLFSPHKTEFQRRDHDISLHMEITVPPEDDVEVRRLTLINHSDRTRHLALTSYAEVVLALQSDDRRHPAFNKLFVESEYLPEFNTMLYRRRSRSADETPIYMAHSLVLEQGLDITGAYEGDRGRFLGRGRSPRSPVALERTDRWLSGAIGSTLDPIMALGQEIQLEPYTKVQIAYMTLAAGSREEVLELVDRYQAWHRIERSFDLARAHSERELRQYGLSSRDVEYNQLLLSFLHYPYKDLRADPNTLATNTKGQSGLWAYAISGDYPILLVKIKNLEELALVREVLLAHAYWREKEIKVDLVIVNQRETGYDQELQAQLLQLIKRVKADTWLDRRGGIFLLRADQMREDNRVLLETAARVILDGRKGSLPEQLDQLRPYPARLPHFVPTLPGPEDVEPTPPLIRPTDLLFDNSIGGFSPDGREYVIWLEPGQWSPAPWVNVISNPNFGFLVSESSLGFTWCENSGENRLTPWRNDPVSDDPAEALYLRDEETGQIWSPTPSPAGTSAPYLIRHGAGYSVFEHHSHGLKQQLRIFTPQDAPIKVIGLRLENMWHRHRRITATYYAEWVLGTDRDETQQYIVLEFNPETQTLLARNPYNADFGERVAFLTTIEEPHGLTADRAEFLGRMGSLQRPVALARVGLAGTVESGLDPCAAIQLHVELDAGEGKEVFFLLGEERDHQAVLKLVKQYQDPAHIEAAWQGLQELWDNLLGAVEVVTPDPTMNLLTNRWLLYQVISSRVWGRSALYQSSGAYGYRDQLQDVMALMYSIPEVARDHILDAACHQFEEGDVLHWWHPPSGRGVRTRCSDDLLWLPYVTAHYVATTGDHSILSEQIPFLKGEPLEEDEQERYGHYVTIGESHTLYEHCQRALKKGSTRGQHNLPLIGSGDWNDGMSRVGIEGRGESVWLGWFLYATLNRYASLCDLMGDEEQGASYRQQSSELLQAIEANAWDGNWYRRAYYDDGTPLGSIENNECQINSIVQSWAILSGVANDEVARGGSQKLGHEIRGRAERAMKSVTERLVRDDQQILLLVPPFDKTSRDPGYIKGYPPGIRENGGQYTHAALWIAWAFADLGEGDRAEALYRILNPIYRGNTLDKVERYRVEPYVVAADVYSVPPHIGRGGWTWYTGSAGWMYRLGLEAILGLRRVGKALQINPCIPGKWSGYEITYKDGDTSYRILVDNPEGVNCGVKETTLDGKILTGVDIPLLEDGEDHTIHIKMG
ncbi:MAG TPA: cellobiose phosphorylase [Anaerolineae bacterium]|nr:cellobiose phosphorylase [Anaerolineae bacterium]